MERVMRCKLQLNGCMKVTHGSKPVKLTDGTTAWIPEKVGVKVTMGAVYQGDNQANLENAVFGKATPHGSFEGTILNDEVARRLEDLYGREFYVDFILVPLPEQQG